MTKKGDSPSKVKNEPAEELYRRGSEARGRGPATSRTSGLGDFWLLKARQQGARICSIVEAAPASYQDHLRRHLEQSYGNESLMLTHLLCSRTTSSPSSSAPAQDNVDDDCVRSVIQANLGLVEDHHAGCCQASGQRILLAHGMRHLMGQVPALRQLRGWGLFLREDSSITSESAPRTPPTPEALGPQMGPEDFNRASSLMTLTLDQRG